jgi:hypothetical protein
MKGMYTARGIRAGLTTMSFARVKSLSQSVHLIFFGCQRRPPPLFNLRTKQRTFCEAESIWGCDTACRPFGESLTGDEEPMKADRVGMHRPAAAAVVVLGPSPVSDRGSRAWDGTTSAGRTPG